MYNRFIHQKEEHKLHSIISKARSEEKLHRRHRCKL